MTGKVSFSLSMNSHRHEVTERLVCSKDGVNFLNRQRQVKTPGPLLHSNVEVLIDQQSTFGSGFLHGRIGGSFEVDDSK